MTTDTIERDELGELLIEKGFAPNDFVLDLNHSLTTPYDMELPAPWNLPSRLFRFPIEVSEAGMGGRRRIGLMHPLLGDHPFVQRVAAELAIELDPEGAPNAYGYSNRQTAQWWHAVDLVSSGLWRELLETRRFTTEADIAGAVSYALQHSPHDKGARHGYITTAEAREMMRAIGDDEPGDRSTTIRGFMRPLLCQQDSGRESWPINTGRNSHQATAWAMIHGIEDGRFAYDRSGFLQWTEAGRDWHSAPEGAAYTTRAGQGAFSF